MKKEYVSRTNISLSAISLNESVARSLVGVAVSVLDPTVEELADIRCAVSEAVTNAIVHGYKNGRGAMKGKEAPMVYISVKLYADRSTEIEIRDRGVGIADIKKAREPLYTTDETGERSGMGFAVMEAFTDSLRVISKPMKGTRIILRKKLSDKVEGARDAE
jgi:stage II sporulation protein AB (anti-sigma F factor)